LKDAGLKKGGDGSRNEWRDMGKIGWGKGQDGSRIKWEDVEKFTMGCL